MSAGRELTSNREYLSENRRLILVRSLGAALASAIPVPLVEEWVSATILRGTIRKVADNRGVDVDETGVRAVADGAGSPPEWAEIAGGRILYKYLTRPWRRLFLFVVAARRIHSATKNYLVCTLFDHYCSRLHVGAGIDGDTGRALRKTIDAAIAEAPGGLGRRLFQRALVSSARASIRAPLELADWATGGATRRLLRRRNELEAVAEVDEAIERQLRSQETFLARAAVGIELELAAEANPYIESLLQVFERMWREREQNEQ